MKTIDPMTPNPADELAKLSTEELCRWITPDAVNSEMARETYLRYCAAMTEAARRLRAHESELAALRHENSEDRSLLAEWLTWFGDYNEGCSVPAWIKDIITRSRAAIAATKPGERT